MSDNEDHTLAVRIPKVLIKKMDARAKYLRGKLGYKVTRSDVARNLIQEGLKDGLDERDKKR